MASKLNTPEETVEKIRVSRATVYGLIKTGDLRSVKIGRRRFITDDAIDEYIAGLEAEAGAA